MRVVAWGLLRLVHPFPSALDAVVTLVLARIAGASLDRAALLAISMLAIQFSIGAANDVVDAPADAVAGRGKPLVDGQPSRQRLAVGVAATLGPAGVALAVVAGPAPALVAAVGYGIGLAYDLRLKATAWSWLPFAAGIPLLPVYAWVGRDRPPARRPPRARRRREPGRCRARDRELAGRRGPRCGKPDADRGTVARAAGRPPGGGGPRPRGDRRRDRLIDLAGGADRRDVACAGRRRGRSPSAWRSGSWAISSEPGRSRRSGWPPSRPGGWPRLPRPADSDLVRPIGCLAGRQRWTPATRRSRRPGAGFAA